MGLSGTSVVVASNYMDMILVVADVWCLNLDYLQFILAYLD